jgi:hypothetical protein
MTRGTDASPALGGVIVGRTQTMSLVGRALLLLVASLACARNPSTAAGQDATVTSPRSDPRVETRVMRVIEQLEERRRVAKERHERRDEEMETHTKDDSPHLVDFNAASQRRFAQIWWAARYPHGQKALPSIEIQQSMIRCAVSLSGEPKPGSDSDWTDFETRINDLPAGRYRVIAPLREVTLEVP